MITRLEIDGFKSLRDFAVDLEPLTVFIGPNSAGKSNILDALALLSRLTVQPVEEAFKHGRGRALDQFTRRGGEAGRTIRFAVEVSTPGGSGEPRRFRYEVTIARSLLLSGVEHLDVENETFQIFDHAANRWSSSTHSSLLPPAVGPLVSYMGTMRKVFGALAVAVTEEARLVADELTSYRLFHLDSVHLRDPSERLGSGLLAPDASNLPTVLANLPGPTLGGTRADLVSLVPGISSFDIVAEGDAFRLDFELSGGERLPARLVSDGTLRILALLTALRTEPRPAVIGVEEPENGVYPGRLRKLLEYLQEIAAEDEEGGRAPTQLILTTHSPVVLGAMRAHPEHLRFVDLVRRDGQLVTRARTVGPTGGPDRGRLTISLREIDELLQAADSETGQ